MRLRIQYTQQSSSWRRVARIVRANRMLRDRTLSITLSGQDTWLKMKLLFLLYIHLAAFLKKSYLVIENPCLL